VARPQDGNKRAARPACARLARMRCWRLAASIALAGCAAFEGRHPDESWQKVTSPHFVLWTDFDEKTAEQAATVLENTRDALVSAAWPERNFDGAARTEVFVLTS